MEDPRIVDWLRWHRNSLSKLYIEAAQGGDYPHYEALSPLSLKAVADRMARTLIYHADRDDDALGKTEKLHRQQARLITAEIPILEKLAFVEERVSVSKLLMESDPEAEPFREGLLKRLAEATRYTKITTRSVELDRKMAELSGIS